MLDQGDMSSISLLIRAWNEADALGELLESIKNQDFEGMVELVVVDAGSTDQTPEVARIAGAKVAILPQAEFSYPKSLNVGMEATSNEIVAEVVAHALPIGRSWLSAAASHFSDPQVAGVYSPVRAQPSANWAEKVLYSPGYWMAKLLGVREVTSTGRGVFGATNIALRRSLWEKRPFNEAYGAGGEDSEWADWALKEGYKIICDPGFAVYHSHGLTASSIKEQIKYWGKLSKPLPFNQEDLKKFRKDLKF
jgi:glycosyltransferase involved in cell wall biosynthesis